MKLGNRGASCSINGKQYERLINDVCAHCTSPHTGKPLSTSLSHLLGGCSERYDLQLNWKRDNDINIEIKRSTAPDWIQARLCMDAHTNQWCMKGTGSSVVARPIIDNILKNAHIYEKAPPFLSNDKNVSMTYDQWNMIKHNFPDVYISCPDDAIARAYQAKGVHYIQLEHHGLYHTGEDVCNFGVPLFACHQRLRIRCKRHGLRCKITGKYIPTSVTAAFRPIFKTLVKSPISMDNNFERALQNIKFSSHKSKATAGCDQVLTRAAYARLQNGATTPYRSLNSA